MSTDNGFQHRERYVLERELGDLSEADAQVAIADLTDAVPAVDGDGNPLPLAAGTFALYQDGQGGLMFVVEDTVGRFEIPRYNKIPGAMIQAVMALKSGSKMGALKALMGRRRDV